MARLIERLPGTVAVMVDTPRSDVDVPACLAKHRDAIERCTTSRTAAFGWRHLRRETEAARRSGATVVDLSDADLPDRPVPSDHRDEPRVPRSPPPHRHLRGVARRCPGRGVAGRVPGKVHDRRRRPGDARGPRLCPRAGADRGRLLTHADADIAGQCIRRRIVPSPTMPAVAAAPSRAPSASASPAPSASTPPSAEPAPTASLPRPTTSRCPSSTSRPSATSRRRVDDRAWEPVVATHPTDPDRLAVVYQHRGPGAACRLNPIVRISHDARPDLAVDAGGARRGRSGRGASLHAAIAWGPGPNWQEPPLLGEHDGAALRRQPLQPVDDVQRR